MFRACSRPCTAATDKTANFVSLSVFAARARVTSQITPPMQVDTSPTRSSPARGAALHDVLTSRPAIAPVIESMDIDVERMPTMLNGANALSVRSAAVSTALLEMSRAGIGGDARREQDVASLRATLNMSTVANDDVVSASTVRRPGISGPRAHLHAHEDHSSHGERCQWDFTDLEGVLKRVPRIREQFNGRMMEQLCWPARPCFVCNEQFIGMRLHTGVRLSMDTLRNAKPGVSRNVRTVDLCDRCFRNQDERFFWSVLNDMVPDHVVPEELRSLTVVEEFLIARAVRIVHTHILAGGQLSYSRHSVCFSQEVQELATVLPRLPSSIDHLIVVRQRNCGLPDVTCRVRRHRVQVALEWLKDNNHWYRDIVISEHALAALPEDAELVVGRDIGRLKEVDSSTMIQHGYCEAPTSPATQDTPASSGGTVDGAAAPPDGSAVSDAYQNMIVTATIDIDDSNTETSTTFIPDLSASSAAGTGVPSHDPPAASGSTRLPEVVNDDACHELQLTEDQMRARAFLEAAGVDISVRQARARAGMTVSVEPSDLHETGYCPECQHCHTGSADTSGSTAGAASCRISIANVNEQHGTATMLVTAPPLRRKPVSEFIPWMALAYPTLFPTGAGDWTSSTFLQRLDAFVWGKWHDQELVATLVYGSPFSRASHPVSLAAYAKHLLRLAGGRFATHPTFRYAILNCIQRASMRCASSYYVHKHCPLSAATGRHELEDILNGPSGTELADGAFRWTRCLRGTREYWVNCQKDLVSMIKQMGTPQLYATLSSADMHLPELTELLETRQQRGDDGNMLTRRELIIRNPDIMCVWFWARCRAFLEVVLPQVVGMKEYYVRMETQVSTR